MANFVKFQHVERFGKEDTSGILQNNRVLVTPKIDGTNASIWVDDEGDIACGSRTRQLSAEKDNAGFFAWVHSDNPEAVAIRGFLADNPCYRIFGEFMGSTKFIGSIKDYNSDALGQLWIFDVMDRNEHYVDDRVWRAMFANCDDIANYCVPILAELNNPTMEDIEEIAKNNTFLLDHANHAGEGVVVRAPGWTNKYGRPQWAKFVLDEYKQVQKASKKKATVENPEQYIVDNYVTDAELSKALAKTELQFDEEFDNHCGKHIGYLLQIVWQDCVLDEIKNWLKKLKNATIDFAVLKNMCDNKVKEYANIG